ncbi:NucA/NucB deoxyribonuclease domain-containing protein [Kitasatospora sp. NPDC059327]|uniref:NucA/NucB deoxyribonuclease domain-containing protein n=1 Tax=Kitasatospora sp. NPDC059327 TaxID=3346803 RepID=UPI00367DCB83
MSLRKVLVLLLATAAAIINVGPASANPPQRIVLTSFTSNGELPDIPLDTDAKEVARLMAGRAAVGSSDDPASTALPHTSPSSTEKQKAETELPTYSSSAKQTETTVRGVVDFEACRKNPAGGVDLQGIVINHFDYCRYGYLVFSLREEPSGRNLGTLKYRETHVGHGSNGSREALISAELDDFSMTGIWSDTSRLKVFMGTNATQGQAACKAEGATNPIEHSVAEWKENGFIGWSIVSNEALGEVDDKKVNCTWQLHHQTLGFANGTWSSWIARPVKDIRFDSATYLPKKAGAIFSGVTPYLTYSRSDARVKGVAEHIYTAFTNPNSTLPARTDNGTKTIPGNVTAIPPSLISRLYPGANPIAQQAYDDNRAVVSRACASIPHNPGEECDEFPFASTWEGAARGDQNFSVRYVDGTENGTAGSDLSNWYGSDRILHNDKFGVKILP